MTLTHKLVLISILTTLLNLVNSTSTYDCAQNSDCNINCTYVGLPSDIGCGYTNINGKKGNSLTVDCSSPSPYKGGCQLRDIYCPMNGDCIINCNDYYGCYKTNIYAPLNESNSLTIYCNYSDSSCTDTTIIASASINSLNITCIGYGNNDAFNPGSLSSTTCHNMIINIENNINYINIDCKSDYSCSNNILYANNSLTSSINISAMGLYSFYENIIYAQSSLSFNLFCGSESYTIYKNNQFGGCINSTLYLPSTQTGNPPRSIISCEGEGCYGPLNIYSPNGALDFDILLNGCSECDQNSCINEWNLYCSDSSVTFTGDSCIGNEDNCECKAAQNNLLTTFIQNDMICDIFERDYVCYPGIDCNIDCRTGFSDGCRDKIINGAGASNLYITCDDGDDNSCDNARISCPNSNSSECHINCIGSNSCFETEIHGTKNTKLLNITCLEKDACSYLEVNADHANEINMNCIISDSCDNFNIYGNYTNILKLHCKPNDIDTKNNIYSSSYASCNNFNIYANNNYQMISIECIGDFSCYKPNIYANNAYVMYLNADGQYSLYEGNIYSKNIKSMFYLYCRSEFGEQACYKTNLYAPKYNDLHSNNLPRLAISCEGHGCFYLNLYAINGYSDVTLEVDGCSQCNSINDCVQNWFMYCGTDNNYGNLAIFDGLECSSPQCDCLSMQASVANSFKNQNYKQCGFFSPDIKCDTDAQCVIDCDEYMDGCDGMSTYIDI